MWFIFSTNTHLLLLLCGISFDISLYKNSNILALMELVIYLRGIAKADGHRTVSEMVMSCAYGCAGSRQDVEEGVRESLLGKVTFALRLLHGVRRSQALKATQEREERTVPVTAGTKRASPKDSFQVRCNYVMVIASKKKGGKKSGNSSW